MNSERLMNEQRLALLKTIRKENPSLRRYMNDIINAMENPESTFNTGKMTQSTDLDRTTAIRLCDAFAVAKMYSEKYHLDFPELIEFVSEKTLEFLADGKITLTAPFKERMKYLIRQQFPFRNPLLSRSGRRNMLSYELADKEIWGDSINEDENSQNDDNLMLETPILFTNNANVAYSEMEYDLETKMLSEVINKALGCLTPREKQVIQLRFGLNGAEAQDLVKVSKKIECTKERTRQVEAKAIRKMSGYYPKKLLKASLPIDDYLSTPIGKCTQSTSEGYIQFPGRTRSSKLQYDVHCACGGTVSLKISYNGEQIRQRLLVCQRCGNAYELNAISVVSKE